MDRSDEGPKRGATGSARRLHERFFSEHVLLESRDAVERVEGLVDDFAVRVDGALEVTDVDELVDVPSVTERRTDRHSVLGVRVEHLSHLRHGDRRQLSNWCDGRPWLKADLNLKL